MDGQIDAKLLEMKLNEKVNALALMVFKIILNVIPYDPRVYALYFTCKDLYMFIPFNRSNEEDKLIWKKYALYSRFTCHELGSLSLLEKVKVPPFLGFLFDGVFIGDFTSFYCFVKINRQWYKVPNLIVPFLFVRKETYDTTLPLSSGKCVRR